jgi:hypothetical protein
MAVRERDRLKCKKYVQERNSVVGGIGVGGLEGIKRTTEQGMFPTCSRG